MEKHFKHYNRIVEAFDIFLKEIELQINENIDFNKDKIKSLLKKFEEIEYELKPIQSLNELIRDKYKNHVTRIDDLFNKKDNSDQVIERIIMWELEESKKILRLISEIKERKRKVDQRLKEIGIKFCFR
jgi:hypothetical protein